MSTTTRCKFVCNKVTKQLGFNGHPFVYGAEFGVVYGNSEENKKFFAATPSGNLTVGTAAQDVFEVGKEYYLDFTAVNN